MLSQCANPQCSKAFLRLREGKLFLVETEGFASHDFAKHDLAKHDPAKAGLAKPSLAKSGEPPSPRGIRPQHAQRQVERFWLCDNCAAHWTLVYDPDRGVALAPLRRPAASVPAEADKPYSGVA
jgi:hypothetical protein